LELLVLKSWKVKLLSNSSLSDRRAVYHPEAQKPPEK